MENRWSFRVNELCARQLFVKAMLSSIHGGGILSLSLEEEEGEEEEAARIFTVNI